MLLLNVTVRSFSPLMSLLPGWFGGLPSVKITSSPFAGAAPPAQLLSSLQVALALPSHLGSTASVAKFQVATFVIPANGFPAGVSVIALVSIRIA